MSGDAAVRGRYLTGVRRREEILDAAVKVFGTQGYVGSTIKQIADRVGVTSAAVLRYFSKEQLLVEVLEHWERNQFSIAASQRGIAYFRAFDQLMRYHEEHPWALELFLVFATESTAPEHPAHEFMVRRYESVVARMFDEIGVAMELGEIPPMPELQRRKEAHVFCATLDGLEIQYLLQPTLDLPTIVNWHVDQMIRRWQGV